MSAQVNSPRHVRDSWARHHVDKALKRSINRRIANGHYERLGLSLPIADHEDLPEPPELTLPNAAPTDNIPAVCIVGAGAAGLFTAMIFDYLVANVPTFKITYDIFEAQDSATANPPGRGVGGRLYTYGFNPSSGQNDYYDVGAMRFPYSPVMTRTFALFKSLGMPTVLASAFSSTTPVGSIIPYYMTGENEPWYFNDIKQTGPYNTFAHLAVNADPFKMSDPNDDPINSDLLEQAANCCGGTGVALKTTIQDLVDDIINNPPQIIQTLTAIDKLSTNSYLSGKYNYNTIEWLETFQGGTGWYDQSNGETVLEFLDFNYPNFKATWWCIEGGAQQLAKNMANTLNIQNCPRGIQFLKQVTGMCYSLSDTFPQILEQNQNSRGQVQIAGSWQGSYEGVFNSTTLGCMQQMDLTNAGLTYGQKLAIRSLGYGASCKVGMKFSFPWWRAGIEGFEFGLITKGGLGHSDLPIRTTVYPSYNISDPLDQPAVLLCSYEWTQDAQRIGAYISSSDDPSLETDLKDLVLRDLALMHSPSGSTASQVNDLYAILQKLYVSHYAHDWSHDQTTFGAFAFFRPQQFGSMWPAITATSPCLNIIGEAASTHHAWVVGALESALHSVYGWLTQQTNVRGAADAANFLEGLQEPQPTPSDENPIDTTGNVFGGLPPWTSAKQRKWQRILGRLREEELFERRRKDKA